MFSTKGITAIFVCILLLMMSFCARKHTPNGYRIVSLSPAMTEILFSLGAGDKIVGVTTFCDFPVQAKKITKVGDFSHPSIERIVGLKPNLVIVNLPEQTRVKKELDKLNIETFVSAPSSLAEIYHEISALGTKLGFGKTADSLVQYMTDNLKQVVPEQRKKIYIEISPKPIVTIGAKTFLNDLIYEAGGINIFTDLDKDYPVVGQETVILRNPDIIIVLHPQEIAGRTGWHKVTAIMKDRVYNNLNPDHLMRPGPRLVQGFKQLVGIIND
jgi:iron complex transport system substrate-binding protein